MVYRHLSSLVPLLAQHLLSTRQFLTLLEVVTLSSRESVSFVDLLCEYVVKFSVSLHQWFAFPWSLHYTVWWCTLTVFLQGRFVSQHLGWGK